MQPFPPGPEPAGGPIYGKLVCRHNVPMSRITLLSLDERSVAALTCISTRCLRNRLTQINMSEPTRPSKRCKCVAERRARDLHQPREGITQLQNKKKRSGRRNGADDHCANQDRIRSREHAEADKDHCEPEDEHYQEWYRQRTSCLFEQEKPCLS